MQLLGAKKTKGFEETVGAKKEDFKNKQPIAKEEEVVEQTVEEVEEELVPEQQVEESKEEPTTPADGGD
jgi:hypothetical protein